MLLLLLHGLSLRLHDPSLRSVVVVVYLRVLYSLFLPLRLGLQLEMETDGLTVIKVPRRLLT